jgi:hypothetical protein
MVHDEGGRRFTRFDCTAIPTAGRKATAHAGGNLFEFWQDRIDVVPSVAAHAVGHHLRGVSAPAQDASSLL